MRVLLLSSIFLSISTILLSSLGLSCPVTVPTVSYVSRCPSNESEWESAAQHKQCNKLATLQSCTETEKFVYHCVLNKDGTKYLEVCAQSWFMSGFCARFSVADGRIINDPGLDCTKFSTPCPSRFLSNESFKYQGCYDYLQQSTPSKIIEKKTAASERESDNSALIGLLCFFVMTTLLLPIIIVLVFKRKELFDWCRSRRKDTEKCNDHTLEPAEEERLLMEEHTATWGTPHRTVTMEEESNEANRHEENQVSCIVDAAFEEERKKANKITITPERADDDEENDNMVNFRTLSGLEGRCSVKNVTVISELRENLSIELSEKKQNVWVVQEDKGILYKDETPFTELENRKQIEVMIGNSERSVGRIYEGKEPKLDVISKSTGTSQKSRMSCKHFTEPENLFNYTKEKIFGGKAEVKCPECNALWKMEELMTKSNMSPDEQKFFWKAMSNNTQAKKTPNPPSS